MPWVVGRSTGKLSSVRIWWYGVYMSIDDIDVGESIAKVRELLLEEDVSPTLKASIETILMLMSIIIGRLGINSKNSSKPPSQDINRERGSKRWEWERKPWGQRWRKGKTLMQVDEPDEIVELSVDREDLPNDLKGYSRWDYISRQVFDIVINVKVTEYRWEVFISNSTGKKFVANFPEWVSNSVQYGDGVKAHCVYLSQYQLLPYERICEYFEEKIWLPISPGSVLNWNQEAYIKLQWFEQFLKQKLIESEVSHSDETGINIDKERYWLHGNSNDQWTHLMVHKKRGKEAMDAIGILPHYHWYLCHDHWKPYYRYESIIHSLCNAHHLRELQYVCDTEKNHQWAKDMYNFLCDLNEEVEKYWGKLSPEKQIERRTQYQNILKEGNIQCPPPKEKETDENGKKKRWRIKKSKTRNLLERLINFEDDTLRFITHKNIPFTNNLGERDIRMTKVQQKISGCFRSINWANAFCRIRSYIGSAKKQNIPIAFALQSIFAKHNIFS